MSKFKEKLGEEKYKQFLDLIKDTDIKEGQVDLLEGYIPRNRYNEMKDKFTASEEKSKTLENQIAENKKLLDESEKFKTESEEYKKKFEEQSTRHKSELENRDKEINNVVKRSLVKESLLQNGAKHVNLLMKDIDLDKVEVREDKLLGFDETMKTLKNDYQDMFKVVENSQNVNSGGSNGENPFEGQDSDFDFLDNIKS
jgi:penicillin-binding protein 1A